jgi:hypothetical protein
MPTGPASSQRVSPNYASRPLRPFGPSGPCCTPGQLVAWQPASLLGPADLSRVAAQPAGAAAWPNQLAGWHGRPSHLWPFSLVAQPTAYKRAAVRVGNPNRLLSQTAAQPGMAAGASACSVTNPTASSPSVAVGRLPLRRSPRWCHLLSELGTRRRFGMGPPPPPAPRSPSTRPGQRLPHPLQWPLRWRGRHASPRREKPGPHHVC